MIRRIVSYPRAQWCRSDAWEHLDAQQYPGAAKRLHYAGFWQTPWRKSHTGVSWRWYADACEHGKDTPRDCEQCQDDECYSRDWLGLRPELEEFSGFAPTTREGLK